MPYYYSLDEICKKLYIGYLIDRKYEGTWIVTSLPEGDNKIFKIKKENIEKPFSLRFLYEHELIDFDGNLFKKGSNSYSNIEQKKEINSSVSKNNFYKEPRKQDIDSSIIKNNFYEEPRKKDNIYLNELCNIKPQKHLNNYIDLKRYIFNSSTLPKEFFHYTHFANAINILKTGSIKSRATCLGSIQYDNIVENEVTTSVMQTNKSKRIEQYVRFYLNPRNKTTYSMKKNFKSKNAYGVIIAIDFNSIQKFSSMNNGNGHIFLTPMSAHDVENEYFNWNGCNDIGREENLKKLNLKPFCFDKTYMKYDPYCENKYLMSEILFYRDVPTSLISHLYFGSEEEKRDFINRLPKYIKNEYASRCEVDEYLHWRK